MPGIGPKRIARIRKAARRWHREREATEWLQSLGLTPRQVNAVISKLSEDSKERVRANPYSLIDLCGLSFNVADEIALGQLEVSPSFSERCAAAVRHTISREEAEGNCVVGMKKLTTSCARLLRVGASARDKKEANEWAMRTISGMGRRGEIVVETTPSFDAKSRGVASGVGGREGERVASSPLMNEAERNVAFAVRRLLAPEGHDPVYGGHSVSAFSHTNERLSGLTTRQVGAVLRSQENKFLVLTGGPGTGKTFTVRRIVQGWLKQGKRVVMAAPTARAAMVLGQAVGVPASTIHRLLEYNPQEDLFKRDHLNKLDADAIVIDEVNEMRMGLEGGGEGVDDVRCFSRG